MAFSIFLAWVSLLPYAAYALPHSTIDTSHKIDEHLSLVLDAMLRAEGGIALRHSTSLVEAYPRYQLGQLLHAELLSISAGNLTLTGSSRSLSGSTLKLLLEAKTRYQLQQENRHLTMLPSALLQLDSQIRHVLLADLSISRLYLYSNHFLEGLQLEDVQYLSSGAAGAGKNHEGDLRTPIGIYQITQFIPDETLPNLYGAGALTLDYPNVIDRHAGREGSGIWLHGLPAGTLSRAPHSSEGCVVVPNDSLRALQRKLDPTRTVVLLSEQLQWVSAPTSSPVKHFWPLFEGYRRSITRTSEHRALKVLNRKGKNELDASLHSLRPRDLTLIAYPVQRQTVDNHANPLKSSFQPPLKFKAPPLASGSTILMMQFNLSSKANQTDNGVSSETRTLYWQQNKAGFWELLHELTESAAF